MSVPYKGAPESLTSVMRNDTQMYFGPVNVAQPSSSTAGKVRVIAVVTDKRVPTMKDVPTAAEVGAARLQVRRLVRDHGARRHAARRSSPGSTRRSSTFSSARTSPSAWLDAQGDPAADAAPRQFDKIIAGDTAKLTAMFKDGVK